MNDMIDMSQFVEAKSDQLNSDDLIGGPITVTVRKVTGNDGDQPVSIFYEGDNNKPFKPCKTIRRVLLGVWGKHAADYVGRSMTLYRDDAVTFGGLEVGGIRISHMSHITEPTIVVVNKTRGKKAGIRVQPLQMQQREQRQATKPTAKQWTDAHLDAIDNCNTAEELDELIENGAADLARLETAKPALHAEVTQAYQLRREALAIEGRATSQMGEGFSGEEADHA